MRSVLALLLALCTSVALVACGQPVSTTNSARSTTGSVASSTVSGSTASGTEDIVAQGQKLYGAGEYEKAFELWSKAAEAGNTQAMVNLARMYIYAEGVSEDYAKATEWYQKAIDAGDAAGLYGMGVMYEYGYGVEQDMAKACEWYQKAADAGYAEAMCALGEHYATGEGVDQDMAKAREWYEKGAEGGDISAMVNLALMHLNGKGAQSDPVAALNWITKAARVTTPDGNVDVDNLGSELSEISYEAVQGSLKQLGYDCETTGELDASTRKAARQFRVDHGLAESDTVDLELMEKILEVA